MPIASQCNDTSSPTPAFTETGTLTQYGAAKTIVKKKNTSVVNYKKYHPVQYLIKSSTCLNCLL